VIQEEASLTPKGLDDIVIE